MTERWARGALFVGFSAEQHRLRRMLERMAGAEDGVRGALAGSRWQAYRERCAVPLPARHSYRAPVLFHDLAHAGQPNAAARDAPAHIARTVIALEDMRQVRRWYPQAGVLHDQQSPGRVLII